MGSRHGYLAGCIEGAGRCCHRKHAARATPRRRHAMPRHAAPRPCRPGRGRVRAARCLDWRRVALGRHARVCLAHAVGADHGLVHDPHVRLAAGRRGVERVVDARPGDLVPLPNECVCAGGVCARVRVCVRVRVRVRGRCARVVRGAGAVERTRLLAPRGHAGRRTRGQCGVVRAVYERVLTRAAAAAGAPVPRHLQTPPPRDRERTGKAARRCRVVESRRVVSRVVGPAHVRTASQPQLARSQSGVARGCRTYLCACRQQRKGQGGTRVQHDPRHLSSARVAQPPFTARHRNCHLLKIVQMFSNPASATSKRRPEPRDC